MEKKAENDWYLWCETCKKGKVTTFKYAFDHKLSCETSEKSKTQNELKKLNLIVFKKKVTKIEKKSNRP